MKPVSALVLPEVNHKRARGSSSPPACPRLVIARRRLRSNGPFVRLRPGMKPLMDRRAFISTLAGGLLVVPLAAVAQQAGTVWRIGYLSNSSGDSAPDRAFIDGLRSLGYIEGKNIVIEKRFSAGRTEQFPGFVSDLLRLKVDVIAAWSPSAVGATQRATRTIPIVGISMGDPVAQGWGVDPPTARRQHHGFGQLGN